VQKEPLIDTDVINCKTDLFILLAGSVLGKYIVVAYPTECSGMHGDRNVKTLFAALF
jgi:hypothetical protein